MSNRKEFKQVIKVAESKGWVVCLTKGGHLKWASPSGQIVFSASTPSDGRAVKNLISELRRHGIIIERK
jgi:predicted RNA binding protein YcfA (HicA-like mRNA interferase family)